MDRKIVKFYYDSEEKKIGMHFRDNVMIADDGRTEIRERVTLTEGWDKESIPVIAAKECLQEMLDILEEIQ